MSNASPPQSPRPEGWTWLHNSPKRHYFRDGMSLCRRFALFGPHDFRPDEVSSDNCKGCWRKRQKEVAAAQGGKES